MHQLYSMQTSGNCYKPRLAMHQLGIPFRIVDIDSLNGQTRSETFRDMNPAGKVPYLSLSAGGGLSESNAMLLYLAEDTPLLPSDRYSRAKVYQWMFWEQYSHEPYIAVARSWISYIKGGREKKADQIPFWHQRGYAALDVMEKHLQVRHFLVEDLYSVADISLYAYTHVAHEGEFDLSDYPAIRKWLERVEQTVDFVPLDWRPEEPVENSP